jgi:hypothetical protein
MYDFETNKYSIYDYCDCSYRNPTVSHSGYAIQAQRWMGMKIKFYICVIIHCGPGSVVDVATGYELDGPRIESRWGRDFPHLSRLALVPTQSPVQWVPGCFPRAKSGRGVMLTLRASVSVQ